MPLNLLLPIFCLTVAAPQAGLHHIRLDRPMEVFYTTTPSGLSYQVVSGGNGQGASNGDQVMFQQTVKTTDGRLISSTRAGGQPITTVLGSSKLINGLVEGLYGIKTGEVRRLLIPPRLNNGSGTTEILVYEIEVMGINNPSLRRNPSR